MSEKRTFKIVDANTGSTAIVTIEQTVHGDREGRVTMDETLIEDLYENWHNDDLIEAGVTIEEVK
jgi:hypothetical protein